MKKETFSRYDTADYLKTEDDVARYMKAVMEEAADDPAFIAHALGVVARARNMSQLARDSGLTRVGLYKALSREGNPSFATVMKVARALGFQVSFNLAAPARKRAGLPSKTPKKAALNAPTAKGKRRPDSLRPERTGVWGAKHSSPW